MFCKKKCFRQLGKDLNAIDWSFLALKTMSSTLPKLDMDITIALIYLKMEGTLAIHWDSAICNGSLLDRILEKLHLVKPVHFDKDRVLKYVKLTRLGWQYVEYAFPYYWSSDIERDVKNCFHRYKSKKQYQSRHPILSKIADWYYKVVHGHPQYYGFDKIGDHVTPFKYLDIHVDDSSNNYHYMSNWFQPLQPFRSNDKLTRWSVYRNLGSCHTNILEFLNFMAEHSNIELTDARKDIILQHMFSY